MWKRKQKPVNYRKQKHYMSFMRDGLEGNEAIESPMAIYDWFLQEWDRPLNAESLRQAYLAAWAVSIDNGMVKL